MLLPSKAIADERALLTVGAQILVQLERPGSVSAVWDRLQEWRSGQGLETALPFWWFSLALSVLYAIGVIDQQNGELVKKSRAV